ncbi:unnamed protein product [Absidia cylindrospora]
MSTGLTDAFRPTFSQRDRRDQLASLRQSGTVGAYIDSFLEITLDIPSMTTEEKVDHFVRGLKSNIRCHVEAFDPTTLKDAQRLALSKSHAVTSSINDRLSAPTPADPMDLDAYSHIHFLSITLSTAKTPPLYYTTLIKNSTNTNRNVDWIICKEERRRKIKEATT